MLERAVIQQKLRHKQRGERPAVHTKIVLSRRIALIGRALVPLHPFLRILTYAEAVLITDPFAHGTNPATQEAVRWVWFTAQGLQIGS
jgi:hypothetical protein